MKVMFRNWYEKGYWQFSLLPIAGIFRNEGSSCCIYLGWFFFVIEIWWGNTSDLI